jgi:hypothetical protein
MKVVAVAVALMLCTMAAAAVRDAEWQKVRDALNQGLPRTAIAALDPILQRATARGDQPEAVRAILQRAALEGVIQGSKPEEKIRRLRAEVAKAPPASRPILETVLARWFWDYFRENRWRFVQRTPTTESPDTDFTAWDLPRIYAEIDTHFTRALAAEALLQRTPIATWDDLLPRGDVPDAYRPTLYDFVACEAIEFYSSGEQAGARPEDAFEIPARSPVFAPAEAFLAWSVAAPDSTPVTPIRRRGSTPTSPGCASPGTSRWARTRGRATNRPCRRSWSGIPGMSSRPGRWPTGRARYASGATSSRRAGSRAAGSSVSRTAPAAAGAGT